MRDLIERQAAIDSTWEEPSYTDSLNVLTEVRDRIKALPSAQPERKTECLTEDEIKAIRIHMNAFKERLCNQHRWKEAEEYQQIVDKLDVMLPRSEPYQEGEQNG